jgi:hypothetical protein
MPNSWISHVKDYAKKHNMKYNDALKNPDVKASYKKGGMVDMREDISRAELARQRGEDTTGKYYTADMVSNPNFGKSSKKKLLPFEPKQPMLEGSGLPSSRSEYIAQLYDQANLGANGRVNL